MTPKGVVIHCSASRYGSIELIDRWHAARGFRRLGNPDGPLHVGYHYLVTNGRLMSSATYEKQFDGVIYRGRLEHERGAHALGCNDWIGVCLVGKSGRFTPSQYAALWGLCGAMVVRYALVADQVIGHCETGHERAKTDGKTCPELDMGEAREAIYAVAACIRARMMSHEQETIGGPFGVPEV